MTFTKFQIGDTVQVIGLFTGTVRSIRFDRSSDALYTIDNAVTPDGLYLARENELRAMVN